MLWRVNGIEHDGQITRDAPIPLDLRQAGAEPVNELADFAIRFPLRGLEPLHSSADRLVAPLARANVPECRVLP